MPGSEIVELALSSISIPRANQLAIVTAEDTITDQCPERFGDSAFVFDRQIRNT